MPPDPPARRALPILCPGDKLSCPPVQNLKETPGSLKRSRSKVEIPLWDTRTQFMVDPN